MPDCIDNENILLGFISLFKAVNQNVITIAIVERVECMCCAERSVLNNNFRGEYHNSGLFFKIHSYRGMINTCLGGN